MRQSPPQVPGFSREIAAVAPLPRDDLGRLNSYIVVLRGVKRAIGKVENHKLLIGLADAFLIPVCTRECMFGFGDKLCL